MSGEISKDFLKIATDYSTNIPIISCVLKKEDLIKLYETINHKQKDFKTKKIDPQISSDVKQHSEETESQFLARKKKINDAFVTHVTITGTNQEIIKSSNSEIFHSPSCPNSIQSIFYSTRTEPSQTISFTPSDYIELFLDFSRPPLLNLERSPTLHTPNNSTISIVATDENWFAATKSKLTEFFSERQTSYNWLHKTGIYDIFLLFCGLPFAIFNTCKLEKISAIIHLPGPLKGLIYLYIFFLLLYLFRMLFSYCRWMFPKIEFASEIKNSRTTQKFIIGSLILTVFGSLLYDLIKWIF